MVKGN